MRLLLVKSVCYVYVTYSQVEIGCANDYLQIGGISNVVRVTSSFTLRQFDVGRAISVSHDAFFTSPVNNREY
jgi:hypothetical protein